MSAAVWQAAGLAFLAAFALTPLFRRYSVSRGLVDQPGARRSHNAPVARGGGVAIALALVCAALFFAPADSRVLPFMIGAAVISLLGWRDDHAPLAVRWRLGAQLGMAIVAVVWIGPVESVQVGLFSISAVWLWSALAVVAIMWLMNLFNFMDGSDGLASVQAVTSCVLFGIVFGLHGESSAAWLAWVVAAATLGFLFWNWPGASIFLGDSGSLLLGWCIGCLALAGAAGGSISIWLAFVIVSPFVVDATATLCWRLARGERWYTPHKEHAYQYLIRMGWSHRMVLLAWIALNGLLVAPATALVLWKPQADLGVAAGLTVILTGAWGIVHFVVAKERVTT